MKRIISIFVFIIFSILLITSCSENTRTKVFGSTMEIEVPKGYAVTMATWKDGQTLFYMH